MSTKVHLYGARFLIPADYDSAALASANNVLVVAGKPTAVTLNEALAYVGFQLLYNSTGVADGIMLIDDYGGGPMTYDMLSALAPYVENESFLTMWNDNGELWQYVFLDQRLVIRPFLSEFIFPSADEIDDVKRTHELLDSANVPRRLRGKVKLGLSNRLSILLERPSPNEERTS